MVWTKDSLEAEKGDRGERIIDVLLIKSGYQVCKNIQEGSHIIEGTVFHFDKDPFIYEVKTKTYFKRYNATGFNQKSFYNYKKLNKFGMEVKFFFLDTDKKTIYGNTLTELEKPFKRGEIEFPLFYEGRTGPVVLFPLEKMITIRDLSQTEINYINNTK